MNARLVALLVSAFSTIVSGSIAGARPAKVEGADYLKIRSAPGFEAAERGTLSAGDRVEILEEVGRWAKVRLPNGTTGYVSRKYLAMLSPGAPQEGTPDGGALPKKRRPSDAGNAAPPTEAARAEGEGESSAPRGEAPPTSEAREDAAREAPPPILPPQPQPPSPPPLPRSPWTAAHVEEVRGALRRVETAQDRLAGMIESRFAESGNGSVLGGTRRQVAFWLGLGYVVGWSTTLIVGRWRERRRHRRLRI
jgi:hypothetical protein